MILFVVAVLANALWQPALVASIAWAVLALSRCANATTRHAVWMLALIASLAVPAIGAQPKSQTLARSVRSASPAAQSAGRFSSFPEGRGVRELSRPSRPAAAASALAIARPRLIVLPGVATAVAAVWLAVTLAILVRLCVSALHLERLKRNSLPLAIDARRALSRWENTRKGSRDVRICVSDEIAVPVAVGIFDSMILLPSALVRDLDPADVDRVLLHELAHIRRSDDWIALFERLALALFFFSPGLYWISRRLDLEREVACDDWVLAQSAESVPYARCLARIAEMTPWSRTAPATPGLFVSRKSLSIRIERILAKGRDVSVRVALAPAFLAAIALLAVVVGGGRMSPTIAYTIDTATTLPIRAIAHRSTADAVSTASPHSHGYLDDLANAGLGDLDTDDILALKSLGVDGDYVRSMQHYFGRLGPHDLSGLKALGVDREYLEGLRSHGIAGLSARDVCGLKALGVDPDYIESLAAVGYPHLGADAYAELKALRIDAGYIRALRDHGFGHPTVDELTELKALRIEH